MIISLVRMFSPRFVLREQPDLTNTAGMPALLVCRRPLSIPTATPEVREGGGGAAGWPDDSALERTGTPRAAEPDRAALASQPHVAVPDQDRAAGGCGCRPIEGDGCDLRPVRRRRGPPAAPQRGERQGRQEGPQQPEPAEEGAEPRPRAGRPRRRLRRRHRRCHGPARLARSCFRHFNGHDTQLMANGSFIKTN